VLPLRLLADIAAEIVPYRPTVATAIGTLAALPEQVLNGPHLIVVSPAVGR